MKDYEIFSEECDMLLFAIREMVFYYHDYTFDTEKYCLELHKMKREAAENKSITCFDEARLDSLKFLVESWVNG